MTLIYVCLICITIASFHCLRIRVSPIISTLYVRFSYGIHLHNNVTASRIIYVLCRLLSNVNFIHHMRGRARWPLQGPHTPSVLYIFIHAQINK